MKIRLRVPKTKAHVLQLDNPTLGALQDCATELLGQPGVQFSLNNKDALVGTADTPLRELGVANGDLVWVMMPPSSQSQQPPPPQPQQALPPPQQQPSVAQHPLPQQVSDKGKQALADGMDVDQAGTGEEDVESLPSSQVPLYLLRTLEHSCCQTPVQLLLLAAHAAMLETGFVPSWVALEGESRSMYTVTGSCWASASVGRICYYGSSSMEIGPPAFTLQCSSLGAGIVLAVAAQRHARHISLLASRFVAAVAAPSSGQASPSTSSAVQLLAGGGLVVAGRLQLDRASVRTLWTALKDGLAFPMLMAAYAEAGLPPPLGLLALPEDLKNRLLETVEPHDLASLSCTCAELRHLASQDDLWQGLFQREFPHASSYFVTQARQGRGYKWAFGACWRERRERQEALRQQRARSFAPAMPHFGAPPFYPPPLRPGYPGVIGGDFDRLPQFGPGLGQFGFTNRLGRGGFRMH